MAVGKKWYELLEDFGHNESWRRIDKGLLWKEILFGTFVHTDGHTVHTDVRMDGRTDRHTYIRTNIRTYDQTDICMDGAYGRMNVRTCTVFVLYSYVLMDIRMYMFRTSRWRPQKVDKRMVLEYTHGLFIT